MNLTDRLQTLKLAALLWFDFHLSDGPLYARPLYAVDGGLYAVGINVGFALREEEYYASAWDAARRFRALRAERDG